MKMRSMLMLAVATMLGLVVSACGSTPPVYPDAVFTAHPKIQVIAVAPFIMPNEAVEMPSRIFDVDTFTASDGQTIYYSTEFASEYARGLAKFPGVRVIMPKDMERLWKQSIAKGEEMNPLLDASTARTYGAALKADAVLVSEVIQWDRNNPELTMEWALLATNRVGSNSDNALATERAGTGGQAFVDYRKVPVFSETLTLDAKSAATAAQMHVYGESISDFHPYPTAAKRIEHQPWPEFLHFTAWASMMNAYREHMPKE